MSLKIRYGWIILCILFSQIPYSFSGEIRRWVDEKGTIHFTDDESKIPGQYSDQAEKIELQEQTLKEVEEIKKVEGIEKKDNSADRIRDYLEDMEKKIEMKKNMERKISELEEELKSCEERLKKIEEYEKEDNYLYYQPYRDRKTGKLVPVASPYYLEKVKLKSRIDAIRVEIKKVEEKLSQLMRSL